MGTGAGDLTVDDLRCSGLTCEQCREADEASQAERLVRKEFLEGLCDADLVHDLGVHEVELVPNVGFALAALGDSGGCKGSVRLVDTILHDVPTWGFRNEHHAAAECEWPEDLDCQRDAPLSASSIAEVKAEADPASGDVAKGDNYAVSADKETSDCWRCDLGLVEWHHRQKNTYGRSAT